MFSSIHSKRILAWIRSPRKYTVSILVKVDKAYHYVDVTIEATGQRDAKTLAVDKVDQSISLHVQGCKSHGRVRTFNEF